MDAQVDPSSGRADPIAPLVSPALDPLFWRPARMGVESAWIGHIPFAHWIVAAAGPRVLVELGTHNGVSYCAFCEAVLAARLDTRCCAVDTWEGDVHAGFYGEGVYDGLRRFHDRRYGGFSRLLRATFDAALPTMQDGSIDLLHIDGCHGYDEVRHDFESWRPKLSDRAVVLFHDTQVRERGFGVWRLFAELREQYPGFELLHSHGLGVLAVGRDVPAPVAALCALTDSASIDALRERFNLLGERWEAEERARLAAASPDSAIESARMRARAAQRASEARAAASEALAELDRVRKTTAQRLQDLERAAESGRAAITEAARLRLQLRRAAALAAPAESYLRLQRSLAWRATAPLRAVSGRVPTRVQRRLQRVTLLAQWAATLQLRTRLREDARLRRERVLLEGSELFDAGWYCDRYPDVATSGLDPIEHYLRHGRRERRHPGPRFDASWYLEQWPDVAASDIDPLVHYLSRGAAEGRPIRAPADAPPVAAMAPAAPRRVVFISAEPDTPGHTYRVLRPAAAAAEAGAVATFMRVEEIDGRRDEILAADVLVIWRATWPQVAGAVAAAREGGAAVVFDLDDLMLDPDLATPELLDALRTEGISPRDARGHYKRIHDAVMQSDFCTASTDELAWHMRRTGRPVLVLPNGFDDATRRTARDAARRRRQQQEEENILRIGYAGGSRTHQRDFSVVADTLGRVLRERSNCRLVLFRSPADGLPVVDPAEFPVLDGVAGQIEWRDMVPLELLPLEMARLDVNLAPLLVGNPFCEAKSELKYFEAALADVCTVASPTGPFRRAITHGTTGFLANAPEEWYAAITALLDDPGLRRRMAHAARREVLWRHGPERRRELVASLLQQVGGGREAARAFALQAQLTRQPFPMPVLPPGEVLYERDQVGDAEVTVIVPLYNYADHVTEALDSVAGQTLRLLDLVIVDDASTDTSRAVALRWAEAHAPRFNRIVVIGNTANAGLGASRNAGFDAAETPWVLPLDADNRLRPECCERLLRAVRTSGAAFAYPVLQEFGEATGLANIQPYAAARLVGVPFIDAMALVSVAAWSGAGGYSDTRLGWEDYEFWCRLAERGLFGVQVPGAPLADYRVHRDSLLQSVTENKQNKPRVMADITARHPWLALVEAKEV